MKGDSKEVLEAEDDGRPRCPNCGADANGGFHVFYGSEIEPVEEGCDNCGYEYEQGLGITHAGDSELRREI